ncbi:Methyl-accepting chemotaxis protein IV [Vibrio aerogenes CECT 7868]|uniref:Methyl-accepting chemotaxis protein IV n=1 Tax=Vibrio aerogenes CECT 7868 TaxID=1216006 RepID=A0A1M5VTB6_9VIBR|nr:methyl-accepting chemotaxis protein [Vibrio aerogenes]SHH78496.1 Methyl-accepting chemotaxis protein IV [Vibrio aerogenes CECT 7868]
MKLKSIKTKIALAAGICLFTTAGVLVGFSIYSASSNQKLVTNQVSKLVKKTTLKKLETTASGYAQSISRRIEDGLTSARAIANSVSAIKAEDDNNHIQTLNRSTLNNMLKAVLNNNPDLNGTYSCWEPDAFDHLDADNRNHQDGNNPQTGRFTPYWTRDISGSINVQPLVEYDSAQTHPNGVHKGAWYQVPQKTMHETVTAPLPYVVQGKDIWLATFSVPVIVNGKFSGVVGADYNLDFVQKLSEEVSQELYQGQSRVSIITQGGLVIADSKQPEFIGQSIDHIYGNLSDKVLNLIKKKENYTKDDEQTQKVKVLVPITIGNTDIHWGITIEVDKQLVLANVEALSKTLEANSRSDINWQLLIGLLITITAIGILVMMATKLAQPILSAVNMAKTIARGRFDDRLNYHAEDEVGQLADALDAMAASLQKQVNIAEKISRGDLNLDVILASDQDQLGCALQQMVTDLNSLVSQIKQRSEIIEDNAASVADLSHDLASGATQSASSITEISATITQIAAQIKQSSENAGKANTLSRQTHESAEQGYSLMSELQEAMQEIESSGHDINNIISTIEGIAEQTNLLALNAAIEAARAGEQGRGFAVVADEVRQLAAQSAKAVQQTAALVEDSAQKTQRGMTLSQQTTASLATIVENVSEVSALMKEIAQASAEQALGAEQVSEGINQIDEVTHQNSHNSESCANAASELTSQSGHLNQLIQQFQLK